MSYSPILATLIYVLSEDGQRVLMLRRNKREDDLHYGKYNGLGGKLERGEDVLACMRRELLEEAQITATEHELRGTLNWPGFGREGEDWFGFIYLVHSFEGQPASENPEGTLEWVPLAEIYSLPLWEGDRHFLPFVFDGLPHTFHGVMPYEQGRPLSWQYSREGA